jgi:hypothetical protein
MPDFRTFFDKDYLYAFMLQGKEHTVEIERVVGGELIGEGGKKTKKPICHFKGKSKPLGLNITNCRAIAAMYGNDTSKWVGKRITIYPTTTQFGSQTYDCIRVRPGIPRGAPQRDAHPDEPPPDVELPTDDREPGADG